MSAYTMQEESRDEDARDEVQRVTRKRPYVILRRDDEDPSVLHVAHDSVEAQNPDLALRRAAQLPELADYVDPSGDGVYLVAVPQFAFRLVQRNERFVPRYGISITREDAESDDVE